MRRNLPCYCGVISFTHHTVKLSHHSAQQEQVVYSKPRPASGRRQEGIWPRDVSPASRQGADPYLSGFAEEDSVLAPRVAVAGEFVLAAGQRVEWMGDTESLLTVAAFGS